MRFLRRIEGVTLFNKVRSSEIRKSLRIEQLLLRLLGKANGTRPVGRPRTRWTNYFEDLGWNRWGLHPSDMTDVMEDREVCWRLNLELLPPQLLWKSGQRRKMFQKVFEYVLRHTSATYVNSILPFSGDNCFYWHAAGNHWESCCTRFVRYKFCWFWGSQG